MSKLGVWLPHTLSETNQEVRISIATSFRSRYRNGLFFKNIISDDKNVHYDKRQWIDLNKSPQPTPNSKLHGRKVMLYVWWDQRKIIHFEILNWNQMFKCWFMQRVHENLRKCPGLVNKRNIVLRLDNARPHSTRITTKKNGGFRLVCSTLSTIFIRPCITCFLSFSFFSKCFEYQLIFLRRIGENICGIVVDVETWWLSFERNQQAIQWMASD